jgi:hypothetical protein
MKHIYKWLVGLLLFFSGSYAIGQNVTLDVNAMCKPPSTSCNPFLSEYTCGTVKLQTTHGSPSFYTLAVDNNNTVNLIQLRAYTNIQSNGNRVDHSEGFTMAYSFKKGKKYTITVAHQGTPGNSFVPNLVAAVTNDPPRHNDGCGLGVSPFYAGELDLYEERNGISVDKSGATTSFDISPSKDYSYFSLFSSPVQQPEVGSLIWSIKIVDDGAAPDPNCYQDANFDFCSKTWNGSSDVKAVNPISLACDAFKSSSGPGAGAAFVRRFTAPTITLSSGFVASATDPGGAVRSLRILPSADPCNQALRVATSHISNVQTIISETQLLENINIYPSPSRGLVNINFNSSDMLNAQISVTDQSGRVVYQMRNKMESNLVQLNLEHLSNGVYFIKVNTKNKVAVKKLLISK